MKLFDLEGAKHNPYFLPRKKKSKTKQNTEFDYTVKRSSSLATS